MHSLRTGPIWDDAPITNPAEDALAPSRRRDAARNRNQLIAVARELLAEQPQVSMASISLAAGLARNTIYRHFPNRDALIEAVRAQSSDESSDRPDDRLRPPGELANVSPTPLSVWDVLNKVPPFQLGEQIVAEAQRMTGVTAAAIYLVDLDGNQLRRLAGPENFPKVLQIDLAVGPEIAFEEEARVRAAMERALPGTAVALLHLRGRATGLLAAFGTEQENLRELAQEAAAALAIGERYTDLPGRVRRARPTTPAAELQQDLLPPRVVRIGGAMLAGNVLPGYDIGGDWFDYIDNPEHAWIGIADTEGTGTRATSVAAILLGAFRSARHRDSPTVASAVHLMHQTLRELSDPAPTAAVTIATWNGATGMVQWVSCGDLLPVLVDADLEFVELGERAPRLGAPDFPKQLRIHSRRLRDDERLLLLSDGVTHRVDARGESFGLGGVKAAVRALPSRSAPATVRAIEDAAWAHSEDPLQDDATLVVLAPNTAR